MDTINDCIKLKPQKPFELLKNPLLLDIYKILGEGDLKLHLKIFTIFFHFLQVCATLGTTPSCAFDNILEVGPLCKYSY